jgi:hypothetical protein
MQKAVEQERANRKFENSQELDKKLSCASIENSFSSAIKSAKLKAVVETEQEVTDARGAASSKIQLSVYHRIIRLFF